MACDARCRFIFLLIQCPGETGDSRVFYGTKMDEFLKALPQGFYAVADNAYTLSATLIIPYSGSDKRYPEKDVFNFYVSQLRIKIEQAFGIMVNKWWVFKRPIGLGLHVVPTLVECCMRLHNFCNDNREHEWNVSDVPAELVMEHVTNYEEYLDEIDPSMSTVTTIGRRNNVREALARQLAANSLSRQLYNKNLNNIN